MKKCLHCGYQWTPRIETEPKACPKCKSPRWNEEKRKGGRPKQNKGAVRLNKIKKEVISWKSIMKMENSQSN